MRERRWKNSHVGAQALVEEKFNKPGEKSPAHVDKLFFKGATGPAPSRLNPGKNFSSIERTYGLDYNTERVPNSASMSTKNMWDMMQKGKKSIGPGNMSSVNLISGHYGRE